MLDYPNPCFRVASKLDDVRASVEVFPNGNAFETVEVGHVTKYQTWFEASNVGPTSSRELWASYARCLAGGPAAIVSFPSCEKTK